MKGPVTPATPDAGTARVLVLAPIGRDGPAVAALLRRAGLEAKLCGSLADLVAGLEEEAEVAFVAEEALLGGPADALEAWVARQPPWSDMPFVVLTSQDSTRRRCRRPAPVGTAL